MSSISPNDLDLWISSTVLSSGQVRVWANFEWKKSETAPDEAIGLVIDKDSFNVISSSYESVLLRRYSTSNSWSYVGSMGYPTEINHEYGAGWQWSGGAQYYKGYAGFRVETDSSSPNNYAIMEYLTQFGSGRINSISIGPFGLGWNASGSYASASIKEDFVYRNYYPY